MARKSKADLARAVVTSLRHLILEPSGPAYRDAAKDIIALRKTYKHHDMPDWTGRSPEYRDLIQRLYQQAGVPPDSGASIQSSLRYHVGNVLRETAPADDLSALGLSASGPLPRYNLRRRTQTKLRGLKTPTKDMDAHELAALALESVRAIRLMDDPGDDGVKASLRKLVTETVDTLAVLP